MQEIDEVQSDFSDDEWTYEELKKKKLKNVFILVKDYFMFLLDAVFDVRIADFFFKCYFGCFRRNIG